MDSTACNPRDRRSVVIVSAVHYCHSHADVRTRMAMTTRRALAIGLLVLVGGCHRAGQGAQSQMQAKATPVLRAVWRDATHHLLVVLPGADGRVPRGDCAAPLLIDDASGGVRQIAPAEAAALVTHMQMAGAVRGTCP
ncbi:hypothetical protein [Novosphingobium sp.]|uniref:hypothetical protein n=1 Tax=Novosphingobium sp. TaxID=1874826 RepID=UPI00334049C1